MQLRLSFSSLAPLFLYFIQWLDFGCCYALPSYLGLFHILICKVKLQYVVLKFGPFIYIFSIQETWVSCIKICYVLFSQVYADGDSLVSTYERRASLREFYGSLLPIWACCNPCINLLWTGILISILPLQQLSIRFCSSLRVV